MGNDQYNNYGQVGAMGRQASVEGDVAQSQVVVPTVEEALGALVSLARTQGRADIVAGLEEVLVLESSSDRVGAIERFKAVRDWVMDKLADGTVAIAAGLALAAFGAQ